MNNYYFTFGAEHRHLKSGALMKDYYVKVIAYNLEEARRLFMLKFGDKFAFQYTEEQMNFKWCSMGCYETIIRKGVI